MLLWDEWASQHGQNGVGSHVLSCLPFVASADTLTSKAAIFSSLSLSTLLCAGLLRPPERPHVKQ
jgi:hypothetical protein